MEPDSPSGGWNGAGPRVETVDKRDGRWGGWDRLSAGRERLQSRKSWGTMRKVEKAICLHGSKAPVEYGRSYRIEG